MIFETERLIIRELTADDKELFFDLQGNAKVMNPIPLEAMSRAESDEKLEDLIKLYKEHTDRIYWAIDLKENVEFIGIAMLLTNEDGDKELGYRLREKHWKQGYGTETAEGVIQYSFDQLKLEKITADANVSNLGSLKILSKLMQPVKEYYCKELDCMNQRFELVRK
ncbi:GNAT family N-acetyltransferase [Ulvibacter antarcticus]|uniref:RimJ/RimL family protein N-acetyltransferase n=1 Tax=Ulvibacter antarcticus TaxID=442714 RepID=A0A3L9YCN9_9FLAO|nr:GNAT family N-acetyltransferase [Ulvibacter antarcticus]RMA57140.1 RimJ/RimL family protein N-acetyltransferase [Ulvibacter antarcticus]